MSVIEKIYDLEFCLNKCFMVSTILNIKTYFFFIIIIVVHWHFFSYQNAAVGEDFTYSDDHMYSFAGK